MTADHAHPITPGCCAYHDARAKDEQLAALKAEVARLRADPRPDRREAILALAEDMKMVFLIALPPAHRALHEDAVGWITRLRALADLPERAASPARGTETGGPCPHMRPKSGWCCWVGAYIVGAGTPPNRPEPDPGTEGGRAEEAAFVRGATAMRETLADWHEVQLTMADAMNDAGVYDKSIAHHERERDRIKAAPLPEFAPAPPQKGGQP